MPETKRPYVCGPLTELTSLEQAWVKPFYEAIADLCDEVLRVRAFVPHENYDPVKHGHFTPQEVDTNERYQVCHLTTILIVAAVAPSWGGGIEVEMANRSEVPVILLCEKSKYDDRKISRLLRGNPAVAHIIIFEDAEDALRQLAQALLLYVDRS